MKNELTTKQQRFVDLYAGNGTEAAIQAGYSPKNAFKIGSDLLQKTTVAAAIQAREAERMQGPIANRQNRQEFWTATMRDGEQPMRERLKASELLAKSEGDFLERVEHSGTGLAEIIIEARNRVIRIPDNGRDPELFNHEERDT